MCLFHRKSKPSSTDFKEKPTSIVSLTSTSPRTSMGKRRPDQTLANPNPKSSYNSLSSASPARTSREERKFPMPRKTPGGLPEDPVILGAPMSSAGKQEQANTTNDGYTHQAPHTSMEASNISNSDMFGSMNMAASVAVMTGGGEGGYGGF